MTVDIFREVRERVSAEDAARHYGIEFDRHRKAKCPFHNDHHPSMTFKNGRFRCWVCNAGGDSVDFVAQLYGLDALGSVRRLNEDFHMGLPLDRQQTPQERAEAARAAAKRRELSDTAKAFEAWRGAMLSKLTDSFRVAHFAMQSLEAPEDFDRLTDSQVLAIREQAHIEWLIDALSGGTMEQQMQIFRERGQIERLCEEILNSTQTKSGAA